MTTTGELIEKITQWQISLNSQAQNGCAWGRFAYELERNGDELSKDYHENRSEWKEKESELLRLISEKKLDKRIKIFAMRVLSVLEGATFSERLLDIGANPNKRGEEDVDIRAWALYFLEITKLQPKWVGGIDTNIQKLICQGLNDDQAKVRQWSAYILGDPKRIRQTLPKSEESVCLQIERGLIEQWYIEFDIYVLRQILKSLGQIGGYSVQLDHGNKVWQVVEVLKKAANHPSELIREQIPDALVGIGNRFCESVSIPSKQKIEGLNRLMEILGDIWLPIVLTEDKKSLAGNKSKEGNLTCAEKITAAMNRLEELEQLKIKQASNDNELVKLFWSDIAHDEAKNKKSTYPLYYYAERVLETKNLNYESYRVVIQMTANSIATVYAAEQSLRGDHFTDLAKEGLNLLLKIADPAEPNSFPKADVDDIRKRAVDAIRSLLPKDLNKRNAFKEWLIQNETFALSSLKHMMDDTSDRVAESVFNTIVAILGVKDGVNYFIKVILGDKECNETILHCSSAWNEIGVNTIMVFQENLVRTRAAREIAKLSDDEAFDQLVEKLQSGNGLVAQRAQFALEVMGGSKATQALISKNMQAFVEARYFNPIDKADEKGYDLLKRTEKVVEDSLNLTKIISIGVVIVGLLLIIISFTKFFIQGQADAFGTGGIVAGVVAVISSMLVQFFWNPAMAIQKATAELVRMFTALHGYMGRMRLLGLGFAHTYTKDEDNLNFLTTISSAAGDAITESAVLLGGIGAWPSANVKVPDFTDKTWKDAQSLAQAHGLQISIQAQAYDEKIEEGHVTTQNIAPHTQTQPGNLVELTLSKGAKPEGITAVEVPDFYGKDWEKAQASGKEKNISVALSGLAYSGDIAEGIILSQEPKKSTRVNVGENIKLIVSKGPDPKIVRVPKFIGEKLANAQQTAAGIGLKGIAENFIYSSENGPGMVASQLPVEGSWINEGAEVLLQVSQGPRSVPNFVGKSWKDALALIKEINGNVANVVLELDKLKSSPYDEGIILEQQPDAGIMIVKTDTHILLTVSKKNE